jgi:FkbH-like protein
MAEGPVRHYRDRQALLKRLQEGGILLVAVSKNDPQAIRWNEMVLQPEDFAVLAIGWELKPTTLAEIAAQLNLGLDAFVFLDDNPTERGLVASHLPQVRGLWVGAGVAAGGRSYSRRRGVAFAFPIFLFR